MAWNKLPAFSDYSWVRRFVAFPFSSTFVSPLPFSVCLSRSFDLPRLFLSRSRFPFPGENRKGEGEGTVKDNVTVRACRRPTTLRHLVRLHPLLSLSLFCPSCSSGPEWRPRSRGENRLIGYPWIYYSPSVVSVPAERSQAQRSQAQPSIDRSIATDVPASRASAPRGPLTTRRRIFASRVHATFRALLLRNL